MADGLSPRAARRAAQRATPASPTGLYPCTTPAIGQRVTIEGRGPSESVVGDVLGCYRDPTTGRAGLAVGHTVSRGRVNGALRREAHRKGGSWNARTGFRAGSTEPREVSTEPLPHGAAPTRLTTEPVYTDDIMGRLDAAVARMAKLTPAAPGAKKSRMCSTVCTTPNCVRCCPRQIQRADRELVLASAKAGGGSLLPYPVDTTFPHGEGESRCCALHPLWKELGVSVDDIRQRVWESTANQGPNGARWEYAEDVPDAEVVAALRQHPRWSEWEAQATKCITSLEEQIRHDRPKGGRGSDAVELAERRRKFIDAGGDITSREWTDTLRSTERRQFKKYGLTTHRQNPSRAPTKGLKIVQPSVRDDERAEGPFLVELRRAVSPAWELVARARTERDVERRLHAWHGTRLAPGDLVRVVEGRGRTVWLGFATAAGELRAAPPLAVQGGRFGDPQWLDPIDGWDGTETTAGDLISRARGVDTRRLVLVAETAARWALGHRHQDDTVAARHATNAAHAWAMGEGSAADAAKASAAADASNSPRDRAIEAAARAAEIPGAKAHLQRGLAVGAVFAAEGVVRGQLLARMVRPHLPLATVLAARLGLADPLPLTAIRSNPHTPPRARPSARPKARR